MNSATSIDQQPLVWTLFWQKWTKEKQGEGAPEYLVEGEENVSETCNKILQDIKENYWKPFKEETRVTIWTPVMNAKGPLQKLDALMSVLAREIFTLGGYGYWAQRRDAIEKILQKLHDKYVYQPPEGKDLSWTIFRDLDVRSRRIGKGMDLEKRYGSICCSVEGKTERIDFNALTLLLHNEALFSYFEEVAKITVLSSGFRVSILVCLLGYAVFGVTTLFGRSMLLFGFSSACQCLYLLWYSNAPALPDQPLTVEEMKQSPFKLKDDAVPYLQFFETSNFVSDVSLPYSSTNMLSFVENLSIGDLSIGDLSRRFIRWIGS